MLQGQHPRAPHRGSRHPTGTSASLTGYQALGLVDHHRLAKFCAESSWTAPGGAARGASGFGPKNISRSPCDDATQKKESKTRLAAHFLVAETPVRDLLLCAKHLFVAARTVLAWAAVKPRSRFHRGSSRDSRLSASGAERA